MFSTEFNGDTVYVLNDEWNTADPLQLTVSLFRDEQMSLVKRSSRRPFSKTITCKVSYTSLVSGDDIYSLQSALRDLTVEKVVLPLWPAIQSWADRAAATIGGGLMIVWTSNWSQYEIYTAGNEPLWPADNDHWAPALMGFLNPSEPRILSPGAVEWMVDFAESSPVDYALQVADFGAAAGPQPAGYAAAPALLTLLPDFKSVTEQISVTIGRDPFGFNRDQQATFYPHSPARLQRASYTLQDDEPAQMLSFFQDVMGPGASFWASGWVQVARLTADVGAADTVLHVADPHAVKVGDYISIYGTGTFARKIEAKTANTITIDAALGSVAKAAGTCLFQLCLARLTAPELTLNFKRPGAAQCELFWEEMLTEVLIPGDETLGDTIGKLPERAVLFHFWRDYRNGTLQHWYFTSYEQDIEWNNQTWKTMPFTLGDISTSLNLEEDTCQFDASLVDAVGALIADNPLIDEAAGQSEVPLNLEVYFGDLAEVGATIEAPGGETLFAPGGEIIEPPH